MHDDNDGILIVAPLGRDAEMLAGALRGAGLHPEICRDVGDVAARLTTAGIVLLTEESLAPPTIPELLSTLERQPAWSDVPVIVLTTSGRTAEPTSVAIQSFHRFGNVTLLERPIRVMTLISAVESALRARRRQYEVRDHLVERARIEAELQQRAAEAAAESRGKDEFLAMLGHELRNPLGAIAAASHLLDMTMAADDDPSASARRVIARQMRHLTRLVDDLLDVSRVTTGKIELARQPLDVGAAVTSCVGALRAAGRLDSHTVRVTGASAWADADEVRLDQIVNNLLVNALRYTPPGGQIDVVVAGDADAVSIRVCDNGIGIAPDLLPRIFDLFVQGGRAIERTQGGLGIGLTLVRRLVELHGGRVEVHSEGVGRGSCFTVRLPMVAPPSGSQISVDEATTWTPRRVLVVEDHDDARQMMVVMLTDAGHQVYEAANGADGVAVALRERPDVAIIDVGLPGLNGYEVAAGIRTAPGGGAMVLVALTGYGTAEDRRRAVEAGFDTHLVKPVDADHLMDTISGIGAAEGGSG